MNQLNRDHKMSRSLSLFALNSRCAAVAAAMACFIYPSMAFQTPTNHHKVRLSASSLSSSRREWLATTALGLPFLVPPPSAHAMDEDESFASIAARANKISKDLDRDKSIEVNKANTSGKTAYDFSLPIEGNDRIFYDLIHQQKSDENGVRVKAILVVNLKQDDPIARKTIPGLISLAAKYSGKGGDGALTVILCPTDQGYYEPDTSQLIRLKLASEYGYGINPSTIITDKMNLLGTGAHPFWRWLESTCRTPAGLGRVEGNFEKFLIDGRTLPLVFSLGLLVHVCAVCVCLLILISDSSSTGTGEPLRRYPRKYAPLNMEDDIEAVIAGKRLPPARANFLEEWRSAEVESQRDTYRFEKGLNYFDQ
jgi:glutathione peroxidase-family protein